VLETLRRAAVKTIKPLVSEDLWSRLRTVAPRRDKRASGRPGVRRTPEPAASSNHVVGAVPPMTQGAPDAAPPSLPDLAARFGTDKWGTHRYAQHYQTHFRRLRSAEFSLLEIGIGGYRDNRSGGASLRMWKEFFPRAQIIGLDVYDKSFVDEDRILTYKGSQTDEELLRRIAEAHPDLKIIVDDGSHQPAHIRATFAILFPLLANGGFYAIEDTQTSYWPRWGGSADLDDPLTTMGLVKDLIDGLNYAEFGDLQPRNYADAHVVAVHCYHNLVILKKGDNRERGSRPKNWNTIKPTTS
jgi:demethylmacrocin O-methyltransferase